jgi:predicted alpha/beta superfamily hydrolase
MRTPLQQRLVRGLALVALAFALAGARAAADVSIDIDMRAEIAAGRFDPARDAVGVRGSRAPLSWGSSLLARPAAPGRYALDVHFDREPFGGQPVQYKFRIERPGQGPDDGWESGRNSALLLGAAPAVSRAFNQPTPPIPPRRTGDIERLGVVDSRFVAPRAVQVWLPPSYASAPKRRYPVLYLHDGQNVFDDQAAGAEWQADETAQRLALGHRIDAPIIVAVDSGRDRFEEYTPTRVTAGAASKGGGAPAYARFLIEELKPLIDHRYRTRPGAASTTVGGSSLGGLLSLWLAVHHPETFGAALVVSPSVWWDDEFARRDVLALAPGGARPRLWLDIGAGEGADAMPPVRRVRDALLERGWTTATLSYHEDPDGSHDEASWASRFEGMLLFLYAPPPARKSPAATQPASP